MSEMVCGWQTLGQPERDGLKVGKLVFASCSQTSLRLARVLIG